jgi:hypothetical protein
MELAILPNPISGLSDGHRQLLRFLPVAQKDHRRGFGII